MRRQSEDFYRSAHFHPSDPFDLFRTFFAGHDPFHDPFLDPLDGFFSHHSKPHKHHQEVFFPSQQNFHHPDIHLSIFDDLPGGTTTCSTTFQSGDGGTVHITRTVIGGDGSVRREMRFRTPSATRPPPEDGWSRPSRVRRQHSQQCEAEAEAGGGGGSGGGRTRQPRQPSRSAPQRERRGEPDGAVAAGETNRGGGHHQHPRADCLHSPPSPRSSQAAPQHKHRRNVEPEPPAAARGKQQRHRSHVRPSDPSAGLRRETRRRERSCDSSTTATVHCPLCDGKFPA